MRREKDFAERRKRIALVRWVWFLEAIAVDGWREKKGCSGTEEEEEEEEQD